ncbi:MAG: hypothetical protein ACK5L7_05295 [Paludibacteraceae bacterium]
MELQTKCLILKVWKESDAVVMKKTGEPIGSIGLITVNSETHSAEIAEGGGYLDGNKK